MGDKDSRSQARRALLKLIPAAAAARLLPAQVPPPPFPITSPPDSGRQDARLPNGKMQRDEIVRAEYEKNVKDARELVDQAKAFEEALEKDDRFVLSVSSLKKLDDMDKLIHHIRDRMKHSY
ncbi:MAG TPA: hypothetical protein VG273_01430 [Bryobacteraceae bacterium]|jgi:hypothetical protein|nr:hypothetical protein [Bryobacteraceae bacterium]